MRNEIYHRELRWMEQISAALHAFSANFGAILKVMLVIFLPISLLESVILERMNQTSQYMIHIDMSAGPNAADMPQMMQVLAQMLTQEFLLYAITLFLQPVGIIAIAKMIKQYIDEEEIKVGKAIGEALTQMPAVLVTGVLFGTLVLMGCIVIVPGIYFGIAWGLYYYCIALDGKKGWDALRSSKELVQGKWWRTFGYMWLLAAISLLWNSVFQVVCSFLGDNMAADMLYQFLCYISVSFVAVGETLLYMNRKAVVEGTTMFGNGFIYDEENRESAAAPQKDVMDGTAEEKTEESVPLLKEKEEKNQDE